MCILTNNTVRLFEVFELKVVVVLNACVCCFDFICRSHLHAR